MIAVLVGMVLYAFSHSLLAGRGKTWFRRRWGERAYHGLYRLIYNILAVILLLPILYLVVWHPGPIVWAWSLDRELILFAIQILGIVGFAISLFQIDFMRFSGLTQFRVYLSGGTLPLPDEPLQTRGMYALVRHPLYLFSMLLVWPVTTMTGAYLGFAIGVTGYFLLGSFYEERRMVEYYGQDYLDYRRRVPWLIPFLNIRKQSEPEA